MGEYKSLMSPLKLGGFVLKNRMEAANSLPHFLQGPEPYPADPVISHYMNKAKGAAITTCMGINNFTKGKQFPMDMDVGHFPDFDLYDCTCQNYLLQLADSIHFYDSLAAMSIFVGPPSGYPLMKKKKPGAAPQRKPHEGESIDKPFFIPFAEEYEIELLDGHALPHEYDEATLDRIADSYAEQARILQGLGFDMVSLHYAYRANLPAKFMSPLTNRRADAWGGSLENRMRFPLMVLERIRKTVGRRMLVEIVWSAEDEKGGYTLEESAAFLRAASGTIDIVQLRAPEVDEAHPTGFNLEETPFLRYAEYMKKSVPGLAIATIGGYQDLELADRALAEGKADIISMSRAWISNPDFGRLAEEGRGEDVVPCLRCNKCHGRGERDPFVSVCSVNPRIGLEHKVDRMISAPAARRKVAVVGGGPGGMRCAMDLSDRGHEVTIFEAEAELGGAIRHADCVDFKWPVRRFKEYLVRQVGKRGIDVRLGARATPELVRAGGFDVVVAALGAVPLRPPIPGLEGALDAKDVFRAPGKVGRSVVIIGGGEVGVECGMYLAKLGREVVVLEMRGELAADSTRIHYLSMFRRAWEALPGFRGIVNARVASVSGRVVAYVDERGEERAVAADSVIVSAGMRGRTDEALSFYGAADGFYMIGDCKRPATILEAVRSAYSTAARI
jgi:2,4-dienoyl-CoA reductase-like NADH-dependent reductase (Old Yellow Enzyme family)/thioredoxin reductase